MTESASPNYPSPPSQPALKSGFAVAALVCGLFAPLSLVASHVLGLLLGLAAITCAILALRQISHRVGTGRGMAVWGLVLGLFFSLAAIGSLLPDQPHNASTSASSSTTHVTTAPVAADDDNVPAPTASSIPGDGTFLVGSEITPGTYRSTGAKQGIFEFCSWTRMRGTSGGSGNTIDFGTANRNEPMVVTIAASDGAFKSSNCENWTRVK